MSPSSPPTIVQPSGGVIVNPAPTSIGSPASTGPGRAAAASGSGVSVSSGCRPTRRAGPARRWAPVGTGKAGPGSTGTGSAGSGSAALTRFAPNSTPTMIAGPRRRCARSCFGVWRAWAASARVGAQDPGRRHGRGRRRCAAGAQARRAAPSRAGRSCTSPTGRWAGVSLAGRRRPVAQSSDGPGPHELRSARHHPRMPSSAYPEFRPTGAAALGAGPPAPRRRAAPRRRGGHA